MRFEKFSCNERGNENYYSGFDKKGNCCRRWYQHDIDQLMYSGMFRKLQKKSQLLSVKDPLCRSRLIHTLEVVRISKEISEQLGLNTELTEAIAVAHDFGNVPYGAICHDILFKNTGELFRHEEASALMVQQITLKPLPDNLVPPLSSTSLIPIKINDFPHEILAFCYNDEYFYICVAPELLDGVLKHGTKHIADTLEGQVVNYADNIAYLTQDIDDLIATNIMTAGDTKRYKNTLNSPEFEIRRKDWDSFVPNVSLEGIFSHDNSTRTGTLISRFVKYNLEQQKNESLEEHKSSILNSNIPILSMDEGLSECIDYCWKFKNQFYDNELIKTSNELCASKINVLWSILNSKNGFTDNNESYKKFMERLDSPIYCNYKTQKGMDENSWKIWKSAFFIAHLSCDDIDLILNSFQERDYTFEIAL